MTVMLLLALLVSSISLATPSPAEKAAISLSAAVDGSTFVCIGTVERVDTVQLPAGWSASFEQAPERATFGRIRIERVLKGDPTTKVAYHEAWSTWAFDDTTAREGERCLFFLRAGQVAGAGFALHEFVVRKLGGAPVFSSVNSGDGLVPILSHEGVECVRFFGAPSEMQVENLKYHQRLAPILAHIETLARFAPDRVALHATARRAHSPAGKAFDFRILADGDVRLATGRGESEIVRVSQLDEPNRLALLTSITTALGPSPIAFGEPGYYNPDRSLFVTLPEAKLTFVDDDSVIVSGMDDATLARYRRVVRAWALVRDAIDCPDCVDHRPADKEWLGQ